ncbi:MAG: MBL fold metallo-hydrolase [Acidimicrobiales bacterium]
MIIDAQSLWVAQTNSWIVSIDDKECVLIDIPPDPNQVAARVRELGVRVAAVIATHGHVDHTGGITSYLSNQGTQTLPVHLHPKDRHMVDDPVGSAPMLGALLLEAGVQTTPPEFIVDIEDGDVISGAGMRFSVLHTPGHTQGSVCLLLEDTPAGSMLFSGDHLFRDSIGRTDLPGGSYEQLMESMRTKIRPLDDAMGVFPGHGPTTTIGREKDHNPFLAELR